MYVTHRTKKKQTNNAVEVDRTCDNLYGQKSPLQMYIYNIYYMYISPLQMYIYNVLYIIDILYMLQYNCTYLQSKSSAVISHLQSKPLSDFFYILNYNLLIVEGD